MYGGDSELKSIEEGCGDLFAIELRSEKKLTLHLRKLWAPYQTGYIWAKQTLSSVLLTFVHPGT